MMYKPAKQVKPTATSEGLVLPPGINENQSFLDFFLFQTERVSGTSITSDTNRVSSPPEPLPQVSSMMRRYSRPEHYPFSHGLPVPVLPLQKFPQLLQANSINMNDRIKKLFLNRLVKTCARRGTACDDSFGQSVQSDINCLQAMSDYIHHSKYFAEYAFCTEQKEYQELILRQDADGLVSKLSNPSCTVSARATLLRAREKLLSYAADHTGEGEAHGAADGTAAGKPRLDGGEAAYTEGGLGEEAAGGRGGGGGGLGGAQAKDRSSNGVHRDGLKQPSVERSVSPAPSPDDDETGMAADDVTKSPKQRGGAHAGSGGDDQEDGDGAGSGRGGSGSEEPDAGWAGQKRRGVLVERVLSLMREHILPLRRECQVAYLLERLQGLQVAYLGPSGT